MMKAIGQCRSEHKSFQIQFRFVHVLCGPRRKTYEFIVPIAIPFNENKNHLVIACDWIVQRHEIMYIFLIIITRRANFMCKTQWVIFSEC